LPHLIRDVYTTCGSGNSRVGAEKVNWSERVGRLLDQPNIVTFFTDVYCYCQPPNFLSHTCRGPGIQISDDDSARAVGGEATAERPPNSIPAAGNDYRFVLDIHGLNLKPEPP
jgi:hypothetical protein